MSAEDDKTNGAPDTPPPSVGDAATGVAQAGAPTVHNASAVGEGAIAPAREGGAATADLTTRAREESRAEKDLMAAADHAASVMATPAQSRPARVGQAWTWNGVDVRAVVAEGGATLGIALLNSGGDPAAARELLSLLAALSPSQAVGPNRVTLERVGSAGPVPIMWGVPVAEGAQPATKKGQAAPTIVEQPGGAASPEAAMQAVAGVARAIAYAGSLGGNALSDGRNQFEGLLARRGIRLSAMTRAALSAVLRTLAQYQNSVALSLEDGGRITNAVRK